MNSEARIRALLVDDNVLYRRTILSLLRPYPDLEVVGEASNGTEAVQMAGGLQPAVVLAARAGRATIRLRWLTNVG